jgi:CRISPR-associated protein (Cas_Csd1).
VKTVSLDKDNTSTPYRLGRLFAVLEKARKEANQSDLSNYYTDAMKTPSTTFPKLIQLVRSEAGEKYQNLIADIVDSIDKFPDKISFMERGLYTLGYAHQMKDLME